MAFTKKPVKKSAKPNPFGGNQAAPFGAKPGMPAPGDQMDPAVKAAMLKKMAAMKAKKKGK
jgi:hypothetical protein